MVDFWCGKDQKVDCNWRTWFLKIPWFFTRIWSCFSALKSDPIEILIFFEKSLKELKFMKFLWFLEYQRFLCSWFWGIFWKMRRQKYQNFNFWVRFQYGKGNFYKNSNFSGHWLFTLYLFMFWPHKRTECSKWSGNLEIKSKKAAFKTLKKPRRRS